MAINIRQRVGKSRRKVLLFGKPFQMPVVKERPVGTFVVDGIFAVHRVGKNSAHMTFERLFNVARAHLPSDISNEYLIVDRVGLVGQVGINSLCVRELPQTQRKDVLSASLVQSWLGVNAGEKESMVRLYAADPAVEPLEFFRDNRGCWGDVLKCWVTEGLCKDERIVDGFKASVLPFFGAPEFWMPYNPHQIWLQNTGTGKSFFNQIAGRVSNTDISIAGLFGSNLGEYKAQQVGALQGNGFFLFDEVEQLAKAEYSSQIVISLLGYLEQGRVDRTLKIPVRCEGTKTIVFSSNPVSDDLLYSFVVIHNLLQGEADPARLGRRIGIFLMGNDFMRVESRMPITALRDPVRRLIEISMLKLKSKYVKLLMRNLGWIDDHDKNYTDYENTVMAKASQCPDEKTRKFIQGLSYSGKKLRMAAVRIALLEHLDTFVSCAGISRVQGEIEKDREQILYRLIQGNLRSIDNLILTDKERLKTPECAKMIKAKFPLFSNRQIAVLLGVHHKSVDRWMAGRGENEDDGA